MSSYSRTVAGSHANLDTYVELLELQLELERREEDERRERRQPPRPLSLRAKIAASGLTPREWISHCNPHLVPPGESRPAVATLCYDLNSMYATAGA